MRRVTKRQPGRPTEYPWDRWFQDRLFVLVKGQDYDCKVRSMNIQVRQQAARRGLIVHIETVEDSLRIKVRQRNGR
jgi:hypothetical protein